MKKIMNAPGDFVDQSLRGILYAHGGQLKAHSDDLRAIVRADAPVKGKVAIITGGGYGHLPTFLGSVGKGGCDGVAVGNMFTSPSCEAILHAAELADGGEGILFLFGNYMGDQMNFEMAAELLEMQGIKTQTVRVSDDIASAPRDRWQERRGIAGLLFAYKIAGALAEKNVPLDELAEEVRKVCSRLGSYGAALSSCQLPESDAPIFEIEEDEMELGMGIHGEKGVLRRKMMTADELAGAFLPALFQDLNIAAGDEVAMLVNGLGSTSREELYILCGAAGKLLDAGKVRTSLCWVGEYATSLEMAGASVSLLKLEDGWRELLDAPMDTPFLRLGRME